MGENKSNKKENGIMMKVAAFIVDKRLLFFLIYVIAIIFSMFSMNWVEINNDIEDYLPDSTETKEGMDVMEDEFIVYGTARIMVSNISFEDAKEVQEIIENVDGVDSVTFIDEEDEDEDEDLDDLEYIDEEDYEDHYKDGSALYSVTFDYEEDDVRSEESLALVEEAIANYDYCVSAELGDSYAETLLQEIYRIIVIVCIVVVIVLLLTTSSYAEVLLLIINFVTAMILNMGTNFIFGEISFISNSVSSILQLALSIDYAIILSNRFKEERRNGYDVRDAAVVSLSASIPQIFSSSLTTMGGLFAMTLMTFQLGQDLGKVLIKAIIIALITVFTLMPGLLVVFSGFMDRTRHKERIPKISALGKFGYKVRKVMPPVFCVLFVVAFVLMQQCPYVFGDGALKTVLVSDSQVAEDRMDETFGEDNMLAVLVPGGDYEAESRLIDEMEARDDVDYCLGLANIEAMDDYMLTDSLTPREFSEMADLDFEVAEMLYAMYAADEEEYGRIIGGISSYEVPLMDMLLFVCDKIDEGYVDLDDDEKEDLDEVRDEIESGRDQMEGENYDRILVYLSVPLPDADEATYDTVDELHDLVASYYEGSDVYVVGEATSQRDLRDSFEVDNIVVTVGSMLIVLVILLFTFKSLGMPIMLVLVIEGAIAMNFGFCTIMQTKVYFIGETVVSAMQMGANIDYAIVVSTRYLDERKTKDRKHAMTNALNLAFPTIVTSGTIMACAGLALYVMTSNAIISGLGANLARGTIISIILVLFVLPSMLIAGDTLISKTTFDVARPVKRREPEREIGSVVINGTVNGEIHGTVVGTMNAVVHGEVNAEIVSGDIKKLTENQSDETNMNSDETKMNMSSDKTEADMDSDEIKTSNHPDETEQKENEEDIQEGGENHEE